MTRALATFFYVGYMRPAPGTWGTLAALPVGWAIATLTGAWGFTLAIVLAFVLGTWATALETRGKADHDPSEIVIDEAVGVWIALLPVIWGAAVRSVDLLALYPGWISAFVLFRLFDIWKPGPVGWADRRGDALGVMLDDVIAGLMAAIGTGLLAVVAHTWLM